MAVSFPSYPPLDFARSAEDERGRLASSKGYAIPSLSFLISHLVPSLKLGRGISCTGLL